MKIYKQLLRMEGDPILSETAKVCSSDRYERHKVAERLLAVFRKIPGAQGLSAPQIGESQRVCIVYHKGNLRVMYNPVIIKCSHLTRKSNESCISFYHRYLVRRPLWLTVEYEDEEGKKFTEFCTYSKARIVQHEVDHLNGKCINTGKECGVYAKAECILRLAKG